MKTKTIWKWALGGDFTVTRIDMPTGSRVLTVQMQRGTLTLWALVDPQAKTTLRAFQVIGTGWDIKTGDYIATVQDGDYVWHIFEVSP